MLKFYPTLLIHKCLTALIPPSTLTTARKEVAVNPTAWTTPLVEELLFQRQGSVAVRYAITSYLHVPLGLGALFTGFVNHGG